MSSEDHKQYTTADCPACCLPCSIYTTLICLALCLPFLVLSLTEPWDNLIYLRENATDVVLAEDYLTDYYNYYTDADCHWFWNGIFWFLAFLYPFLKFFIQVLSMYVLYRVKPCSEDSYWKSKLVNFVHFNLFYLGPLIYKLTQAVMYIASFLFLAFAVGYHSDGEPPFSAPVKGGLFYYITTSQLSLTIVDYFIFLMDLRHCETNSSQQASTVDDETNLQSSLLLNERSTNDEIEDNENEGLKETKDNHFSTTSLLEQQDADQSAPCIVENNESTFTSVIGKKIKEDPIVLAGACAALFFVLLMFAPLMNIKYEGVGTDTLGDIDEDFTLNEILLRFRDIFAVADSQSSADMSYWSFMFESVFMPPFMLAMALRAHYLMIKGRIYDTSDWYYMIEYSYPFMSLESFTVGLIHFAGTLEPLTDYYFNSYDICQKLDESLSEGCLTAKYTTLWGTWILLLFLLTALPYIWTINLRLRKIYTPHSSNAMKILNASNS